MNFFHRTWEFRDRITVIRQPSSKGVVEAYFEGLKPDLIYLDGCHKHDCVLLDLLLCDKCFPDAQLCGDDYGDMPKWDCASTKPAVLDFLKINDYNVETFIHPKHGRERCFGVIK
tara:strand:- start:1627 stop:1971 length:345 start_codon:yes stop_codon:yes gene_type:complete